MNPTTWGRRMLAGVALAATVHGATTAPALAAAGKAIQPVRLHAGLVAGVPRAAFERAVDDFQRGRFSAAYGQFARMADHGDGRAAAIALLMYREGSALFHTEWDASTEQVADWESLVVAALRQHAEVHP